MATRTEWKPNKKQLPFLSLPFSIKEGTYGGGAGSGKSDVLLMYGICHKLHENPRFKQVFQRRTYPELRNEIIPRSKELYRHFGATFNKTDMAWTFPRPDQLGGTGGTNAGAIIFMAHCENEDDVHKFDSMEINLYTPDELTSFTEYIYMYIAFTRVRSAIDSGLPSIIRAAGMPGGIGHTWVKKRFVDPCPEGGKILIGKGGNKRIYIHAVAADNPYVDPTYTISLDGLADAERKAKKFGDWSAYLGQVFDEFRSHHYPDEPDNALHVIKPFKIPNYWPKLLIGDWGFRAQTYVLGLAISPDKRVYAYREESWRNSKIEEWAPYVKQWIEEDRPKIIKFCKSVGYDQGAEHTIQEQIEAALGTTIDFPNQSAGTRVSGKLLLHEYLRWKPRAILLKDLTAYSEEHSQWLLRNKGLEKYKEYIRLFDPPKPETNLPKLQIFDNCTLLIDAIKACSYDKPKNNKPAEDVMEFDGDDPYDVIRYGIDTADKYFDEAEREFEEIRSRQLVAQKLAEDNDQTAYYRRMERLESQDGNSMKPVRMFSRRRRH